MMRYFMGAALSLAILGFAKAAPTIEPRQEPCCTKNTLEGPYSYTLYQDDSAPTTNGLKMQYIGGLIVGVAYAPDYCPDGTTTCVQNAQTAVEGGYPVESYTPRQTTFTNVTGQMQISFPGNPPPTSGAYQGDVGFYTTLFTNCTDWTSYTADCPSDNDSFDCSPPVGLLNFSYQGRSGFYACPTAAPNADLTNYAVYVPIGDFDRTDCYEFTALGLHPYSGPYVNAYL